MTNEEIDKLFWGDLSPAFAGAFGKVLYCNDINEVIAALPPQWQIDIVGRNDGNGWRARVIQTDSQAPCDLGHGSTPATALCRAALKAKLKG